MRAGGEEGRRRREVWIVAVCVGEGEVWAWMGGKGAEGAEDAEAGEIGRVREAGSVTMSTVLLLGRAAGCSLGI